MTVQEESLELGKILVVDNCPNRVELLTVVLTLQGYIVEQVAKKNAVITSVMAESPDVILLDMSQPEIDSLEVCQKLKADLRTQDIPIIFISTFNETSYKLQAFKYGASDYITKPFQIEEVIARINNHLQINRLKAELKAKNAHLERELLKRKLAEKKLLNLNQQLGKLAAVDALTQVANRRIFDEVFSREWYRGQRDKHYLALILADIDYFKLYNDYLGHQSGDSCLRQVAQAIKKAVRRPADLVARYGGEEFAVILPQTSGHNALQVAEKIRFQIRDLALPHPASVVSEYVSLSLGVAALIPQPKYAKQQLLSTADLALYQAKKQDRDRSILLILD